MHRHGGFSLDFGRINVPQVKSAIQHARRDYPLTGHEALAIVSLLEFAEALQYSLKLAINEDADWHRRFMPLSEVILQLVVNGPLITLIQKVIHEDGSIKDSDVRPLLTNSIIMDKTFQRMNFGRNLNRNV